MSASKATLMYSAQHPIVRPLPHPQNGRITFKALRTYSDSSQASSSSFASSAGESEICQDYFKEVHCSAMPSLDLEAQHATSLMHPEGQYKLPSESRSVVYRWFRWYFFSTYGWLFTFVVLANTCAFIPCAILAYLGKAGVTYNSTMSAASINLLVSICVRHEHLVNILFRLSTSVPTSAPLWVRKKVARVYSYGGMHSGCALATVFWYTAFAALTMYHNFTSLQPDGVLLSIVLVNLGLLATIMVFSHPTVRSKMHNWFEATHRFAGWSSVALLWAQTIHMASRTCEDLRAEHSEPDLTLRRVLLMTPAFWCLAIVTLCIVYPWTRLRKHKVTVETLSEHAVRLHFSHANVDFGQAVRLGTNPFKETHAFAAIGARLPRPSLSLIAASPNFPTRTCSTSSCTPSRESPQLLPPPSSHHDCRTLRPKGFSVVVSKAGDWTSRVIRAPPSHLYIRSTPTYGVVRVATLFAPVLVIATGSGIGPCLSLFHGAPHLRCRVLWCARSPVATYGEAIVRDVRRADPAAWIVDSAGEGARPDLVSLGYRLFREGACEAVVLVSNQAVTRRVMYGLECRGLPTFAPIFDS